MNSKSLYTHRGVMAFTSTLTRYIYLHLHTYMNLVREWRLECQIKFIIKVAGKPSDQSANAQIFIYLVWWVRVRVSHSHIHKTVSATLTIIIIIIIK